MGKQKRSDVSSSLTHGVYGANLKKVQAALAAGADVNGAPGAHYPPIAIASLTDDVGIMEFLLERGADPDGAVHHSPPPPKDNDPDGFAFVAGERALHVAARRCGNVAAIVRVLTRARADPNATDGTGRTPLIVACKCSDASVELVQLLLEAGADPSLAEETGVTALHFAAQNGRIDIFDMLFAKSPATLNRHSDDGKSALLLACGNGHEVMVSRLLSLGARQNMPRRGERVVSGLSMAAMQDHVGVIRVLIDAGISAVGGKAKFPSALFSAARWGKARSLRMLLAADGEKGRSGWANTPLDGKHLLDFAAAYCDPASVSVLLAAGADEATRDSSGRAPRDVVGMALGREVQMDRGKEAAVRRMLERGPAYRARSWAWPAEEASAGDGCGDDDRDAVLPSPPAPKATVGVQISTFRPTSSSSGRECFVGLLDRYCRKDY